MSLPAAVPVTNRSRRPLPKVLRSLGVFAGTSTLCPALDSACWGRRTVPGSASSTCRPSVHPLLCSVLGGTRNSSGCGQGKTNIAKRASAPAMPVGRVRRRDQSIAGRLCSSSSISLLQATWFESEFGPTTLARERSPRGNPEAAELQSVNRLLSPGSQTAMGSPTLGCSLQSLGRRRPQPFHAFKAHLSLPGMSRLMSPGHWLRQLC